MSSFNNRIENRINIEADSTVKLIQELAKLGVFKSKKKTRKATKNSLEEIKQDNEMAGYTKSLEDAGVDMRNIPPIQQIEPGATQEQIEDIQRQNNALIASLRSEVMQNRVEDINRVGNALFQIGRDRFRPSPENKPYDPFKSDVILLGNQIPDVVEERFDQTINQGGPEAVEQHQMTTFPEDQLPPIVKPKKARLIVRRNEAAANLDIDAPPNFKATNRPDMEKYYRTLADVAQIDIDESLLNSKEKMFAEINSILDSYVQ